MITAVIVADSASTTTAWFTLAGALGGVAVTSAVGLTTVILNHRWQAHNAQQQFLLEHDKQLRQERRETFVHYWAAWNRLNHQLRALRDAVAALQTTSDPPTASRKHLETTAPELVQDTWTAELDWREAADAVFLVGSLAVVHAAQTHVDVTEQKIAAVWEGKWRGDENGTAYRGLNDAMRDDLLKPSQP